MEQIKFDKLLLETAFSCMACDGDIDDTEIELIKSLHKEQKIFGDIDILVELNTLLVAINKNGSQFLKNYFNNLTSSPLTEKEELKLIEIAISTIKADDKIEYSEVKFFKVIRSKLKIGDEQILAMHPDFEEYLEQDIISASYLVRLQNDFLNTESLPTFTLIEELDNGILENLKSKDNE